VKKCTFLNNTSEFGSCINLENPGGKVVVSNCLFKLNQIIHLDEYNPGPGSGSAIKLTGGMDNCVYLLWNKFYSNYQPNGGTIVSLGGTIFDFFSHFKGNIKNY
jgi:hypothetical protein